MAIIFFLLRIPSIVEIVHEVSFVYQIYLIFVNDDNLISKPAVFSYRIETMSNIFSSTEKTRLSFIRWNSVECKYSSWLSKSIIVGQWIAASPH